MERIVKNLTQLIGNTPLLELTTFNKVHSVGATIIAKLEYFNPAGSIKDRIAFAMITDAEKKGLLNKDTTIIEPTSGNTGIGLAFVAASKGYKLILTMPETMSLERRSLLKALGAQIILTPGADGMTGAINKAQQLHKEITQSFMPNQFENISNAEIHYHTTAEEIWKDTDHNVDIVVCGVGTGGTISGIGRKLKELNPEIKMVAVEPLDSPVLSGGEAGSHKIQGIGAGFIPKIYQKDVVDQIMTISNDQAILAARDVAKTEGLLVGISSGAALYAALELSKRKENENKRIVVIMPDSGERYLSTLLYAFDEYPV